MNTVKSKITLYMAISSDGFIAKTDGDSDWVSPEDSVNFEQAIHDRGCLIVGRKTFEQFQGELYPVAGVINIVLTSQTAPTTQAKNVLFVSTGPQGVINLLQSQNIAQALLIGGGSTNAAFWNENLIDEIILSVHPLFLGQGLRLFRESARERRLILQQSKELNDGLIQSTYLVSKDRT